MPPDPSTAWGLYVHVPWCRIRCPYCAFHVDVARDVPADAFVDKVLRLVERRRADFPGDPATVYLGGGTPSRLPEAALARLIRGLVAPSTVEVTVEANPEDVSAPWLDALLEAGLTRLSLGVQTLEAHHARRLGRAHTPAHARHAAEVVARSGLRSWSADLMFGLEGQTLDELEGDLDALLALGPPHASLYGLTIEPGTPYERAVARGAIRPADEDAWHAMYGRLVARLGQAGLRRYEVSNFARPGHESVHNAGYWSDRPYLGVGPSAHGYLPDGRRTVDVADTAAWLERDDPAEAPERPTPEQAAVDLVIAGLRGVDGISLDHLAARTGHVPAESGRRRLVQGGLLVEQDGRTRLTDDGFYVADAVVAALVDALVPLAPDPSGQ
jgi:oxygen-independent coproporphyrinogen-3 oxidase